MRFRSALKEKSALDDRVQVLEKDLADKTAAASKVRLQSSLRAKAAAIACRR